MTVTNTMALGYGMPSFQFTGHESNRLVTTAYSTPAYIPPAKTSTYSFSSQLSPLTNRSSTTASFRPSISSLSDTNKSSSREIPLSLGIMRGNSFFMNGNKHNTNCIVLDNYQHDSIDNNFNYNVESYCPNQDDVESEGSCISPNKSNDYTHQEENLIEKNNNNTTLPLSSNVSNIIQMEDTCSSVSVSLPTKSTSDSKKNTIHSSFTGTETHVGNSSSLTNQLLKSSSPSIKHHTKSTVISHDNQNKKSGILKDLKKYTIAESDIPSDLAVQLVQLQTYWMSSTNLKRPSNAVNTSTFLKRK